MAVERLLHHKVHTVATSKINKRDGVGVLLYGVPIKSQSTASFHKDRDFIQNDDENNGDQDDDDDDDDEMEMDDNHHQEQHHANETLRTLIELSPPGVDQIKTIRSCLLPWHYKKKLSKKYIMKIMTRCQNQHFMMNDESQSSPMALLIKQKSSKNMNTNEYPRERNLFHELLQMEINVSSGVQVKQEEEYNDGDHCMIGDNGDDEEEKGDNINEGLEYSTLRPALHEANRVFKDAT